MAMWQVAIGRKNLFSDPRRAALGIVGAAVALLMVLAIDGIYGGAVRQLTRYIDTSPAAVFVAQRGVRNMHMASSSVALSEVDRIRGIPGVTWVDPILYAPANLTTSRGEQLSYVIGYDSGGRGGPASLSRGTTPGPGEMVIDERAASNLGVGVGDHVRALGRLWTISGLTSGLTNIANTVSFVRFDELAAARGTRGTASYLLVGARGSPDALATAIEWATGVTALSRERFSREEADLAKDMMARVIQVMTFSAFLIGLAVVGLTLFVSTLSRLREIGVMKALGARRRKLAAIVLTQAAWTVGLALAAAVALVLILGVLLDRSGSNVSLVLGSSAVARVAVGALLLGAIGALMPLFKVWRVDPATVFRRSI
jgi:putative ABC transport system permease protein